MRKVVVVHDKGAVHPMEVYGALAGTASIVFAVAPTPTARRLLPVMERTGEVVELTGTAETDARALAAHGPDGIVTFSESMLPATGTLAALLGLPYHDAETLTRLTDKAAQRRALREAGVDATTQWPLRDVHDWDRAVASVGLPAVLKPTWGGGSRDTHRVDYPDAGRAILDALLRRDPGSGYVLESLLRGTGDAPFGDYVSVESLVLDGVPQHLAVTGKFPLAPPFRETGQFWPAALDGTARSEITALTTAALQAVGVTSGITHTEIKLTPDGPRIIEVNGRLGGHINELALRACGVDMVRLAGRLALGLPVEPVRLAPDRVFWQYNHPTPTRPCRLLEVKGWREACAIEGVRRYTPYVRPDDSVDSGVMTHALDLVSGDAADHAEMRAQLACVMDLITFTFDFEGETRTVPASALADH